MGAATPRLSARGHDSAEREPLKQDDGSPADLKEKDDEIKHSDLVNIPSSRGRSATWRCSPRH